MEYHKLRISDPFRKEWDKFFQLSLGRKKRRSDRSTIDQGGLWHVSDGTYSIIFVSMEEEIRKHFNVSCIDDLDDTTRTKILAAIFQNEDLLFRGQ